MAPASKPVDPPPGPHPSHVHVAQPFMFEQKIQTQLVVNGVNPSKEVQNRMNGIEMIDNVRKELQLPVRTFNTAAIYYHRFRLAHRDSEYQWQEAAIAALFTACKIEDTLKKSKEVVCASYNIHQHTTEKRTPDDINFELPSKTVIGIERLMLESSGFDFRNRHPQRYLFKLAKSCQLTSEHKDLVKVAYDMMMDLYRTYTPMKQTCSAMAFACLELALRVSGSPLELIRGEQAPRYGRWRTNRAQVMETMLDLLDLYTQHQKNTIVGQQHKMQVFIEVKIALNQEVEEHSNLKRYTEWFEPKPPQHAGKHGKNPKMPITPASPADARLNGVSPAALSPMSGDSSSARSMGGLGQEGTVRFMLDAGQAKREREMVDKYFKPEFEDYEVEVEEPIPQNEGRHDRRGRGNRHGPHGFGGHGYGHNHSHGHGHYGHDAKRQRR